MVVRLMCCQQFQCQKNNVLAASSSEKTTHRYPVWGMNFTTSHALMRCLKIVCGAHKMLRPAHHRMVRKTSGFHPVSVEAPH